MKFHIKYLLLICVLLVGASFNSVWAETSTLTFTKACGGSGTGTNSVTWTVTSDASESTYESTRGIHYGTSSAYVSYLRLTTSSVSGIITGITVNASGASDTSAKVSVTVGGKTFGSKQSLTSSAANYDFSGNAFGTIVVSLTQSSAKKALYVKSITVTYSDLSYTLTAESNNILYGTVSTMYNEITATPNTGYRVSSTIPYEVTSGTATVSQNGNIFTVTASDDCTVRINFEAIPTHTVTFSINGNTSRTALVGEDQLITFPTAADAPSDVSEFPKVINGMMFVGWYGSAYSHASDAPTYVNSASTNMGTSDVTYYAVYAEAEETFSWKKTALSGDLTEGTYVLLTEAYHAFNGTISGGDGSVTEGVFKFDAQNFATSVPDGICEIEFVAVTGGFKMYNASKGYLYAKDNASGNLAWHNSESSYWKYASSNWVYDANSAYLRSYSNSSIKTYSGNTGVVLVLAKKVVVYTYSNYCTSITEPVTISSAKYATYCSTHDLDFSSTDVKVYMAKVDGERVKLTEIEDGVVPANAGVVLYCETPNSYAIPVSIAASSDYDAEENELVGINERTLIAKTASTKTNYILSNEAAGVGFYLAKEDGAYLAAHRAYLSTPTPIETRGFYGFDDNQTTSIKDLTPVLSDGNGAVYDLQGRKVINPTKGSLYIVNGKKVIL